MGYRCNAHTTSYVCISHEPQRWTARLPNDSKIVERKGEKCICARGQLWKKSVTKGGWVIIAKTNAMLHYLLNLIAMHSSILLYCV